MHEVGLCEGILEAVLSRAGDRRVSRVRIRAGIRHGVDTGSMEQAFRLVADGTEAEAAVVEVVPVPATLSCRTCGQTAPTHDVIAVCPHCHGDDVDITGGDELILESIGYQITE
jgi:hydrogenase nickel incorporation protein HypA/HybF